MGRFILRDFEKRFFNNKFFRKAGGFLSFMRKKTKSYLGSGKLAVNTVSAGFVMTEALDAFPDQLTVKNIASRPTPAGRTITPEDVSNVVAMLCGSDAEMIRGQVVVVDGGETLRHG